MSVCGTGTIIICLEDFLGSLITLSITLAEASVYYWVSASSTDLPIVDIPTPFNALFRQGAELSLLLLSIADYGSTGILTGWPSASPFGCALGPDLPAAD